MKDEWAWIGQVLYGDAIYNVWLGRILCRCCILHVFWCFLLILVQVFRKVQQPDWLRRHGELIEYIMDFLFGLLNLVAYILIELNQASADENQVNRLCKCRLNHLSLVMEWR